MEGEAANLCKRFFAGPVTCLAFHDEAILLAGHGPYLKAYHAPTGRLMAKCLALENARIHRIVLGNVVHAEGKDTRLTALYGSKLIQVLYVHVSRCEGECPRVSFELEKRIGPLKDWIMDVQWLYEKEGEEPTELAVAFAHNTVEIIDRRARSLYRVQCQEHCILYAARFFGRHRKELILAAGTVFNEVHVWRVMEQDSHGEGTIWKRYLGHEGVIFGVRFSADGKMLSSVSDDRTIRIWRLEEKDTKPLVLWGHMARVWDCHFADKYLVSISEDTSCRVWKNTLLDENSEVASTTDCLECWEGHAGKSVWSVAISPSNRIVATGGGDSGIRLWSLLSVGHNKIDSEDDLLKMALPPVETYHFPELIEKAERPFPDIEFPRNFSMIGHHSTIVATNFGYLLKCTHDGKCSRWETFRHDPDFIGYTMMNGSACGRVLALGSLQGHLVLLSPEKLFQPIKLRLHNDKMLECLFATSQDPNYVYMISHSIDNHALLHRLDFSKPDELQLDTLHQLQASPKTVFTCLGLLESSHLLMLGTRDGALLLYRLEGENFALEPALVRKRAHGQLTVTSVMMQEEEAEGGGVIAYSTGRDGCLIMHRVSGGERKEEGEWVMERVYRARRTKGWLERVDRVDGELLLFGFFQKRFFVYNEGKNYEMLAVACGGAHRKWYFKADDAKLSRASFTFLRRESVYGLFRNATSFDEGFAECQLQANFHGREVRALAYLDDSPLGNLVLATGGEDCVLRLFQTSHCSTEDFLHPLCIIKRHTSVIRSIAWSRGESLLIFTAGASEELRCSRVELPRDSATAANCLEMALCPYVSAVEETRIMDVAVYPSEAMKTLHVLGAAYSDSVLRIWLFDEDTRRFSLMAYGAFHNKCLLSVKHTFVKDAENGRKHPVFFTSATDGRVAIWDGGFVNEFIDAHRDQRTLVAQSGAQYLVASGGEDNGLALAVVELRREGAELLAELVGDVYREPSAHASSLHGIRILNEKLVMTTALDQRLNLWRVEVRLGEGEDGGAGVRGAHLEKAWFVDVADPSAMAVWADSTR
ncbi:uncharacterized protein VTP21DRAFT_2985 [Calcarisporiella thermophila]|uniref:uncharacterized protein n=1 Tax=Calcarisporiella thermophila TaxID=911321 RepID=UPI0037443C0C